MEESLQECTYKDVTAVFPKPCSLNRDRRVSMYGNDNCDITFDASQGLTCLAVTKNYETFVVQESDKSCKTDEGLEYICKFFLVWKNY